jgi:hypothetical protein
MSDDTGFLDGRKVKVSMGEMERVMSDKLLEFALGGNPQVSGTGRGRHTDRRSFVDY